MGKLTGKVALVTGASAGLGKAITQTFANEGATVVITGRNEATLRAVQSEIGEQILIVTADMTVEEDVKGIFSFIQTHTNGQLDIVVNNVGGVNAMGTIGDMPFANWKMMQDLNTNSQFLTTKYALPFLRVSKGKLIAVTSGMAQYFMQGMGAYSTSKAAVEALMKTVAVEEEPNGIQVNLFDPINVISASNPQGQYEALQVVQPLVDIVASPTVIKQGEVIRPQV